MATYLFSALTHNQTLTFNPAVDTLAIDIAWMNAASGTFLQSGTDLLLTYNGKTVQLTGVTLARLSSSHVTFANGSKLLIGDNTPGTANDGLANILTGTARGDYLNGLGGADTMAGDDGNDVYVVNNAGDKVIETNASTTQIDMVQSWISYTLGANVENLRLMGTAALNGTGNGLANILYANAGNNVLNGGAGLDTVSYQHATAGVTVRLNTTAAQATGGSGSDTLANIENLTGSAFGDTLTGNASGNTLNGRLGNDVLDGLGGADTLNGGDGNDTLRVSSLNFKNLDGGAGTDTLILSSTGQTLDLTALGSKLHNLEIINLNGANTLNLTAAALQNLSTTSDQLVVDGTAGGAVNAGGGWTQGADATANGQTYHTYTQGAASLWVDTAVALNVNGVLPLASLNGANGFRLDGAVVDEMLGQSVSAAGDVNGDGFGDFIIGAPFFDLNELSDSPRSSYVVFGKASGFDSTLDLSSLDGGNGFRLNGAAAYDQSGFSVSGAGDVNGDGFADLIVGAYGADPNGNSGAGSSYVVFGKASGFAASLEPSSLDGSSGFRLDGAATEDWSGYSVSAAGDVNGDGFADLIVGAQGADPNGQSWAGSSYVVFGQASDFSPALDLSGLDGTNGFRLDGAAADDGSGYSVSGAGDVNGDGYADLIVGASGADPNGQSWAGSSYVVFGKASGFSPALALSGLDGTNGFRLDGAAAGDESGASVSGVGDVNGDGYADLIVGAQEADPNGNSKAGSSYVVFGKASGFSATLDLSTLNGTNGFRLDGAAAFDVAGTSVSGAGDVNGDGYADLIIGAEGADPNGQSWAGSSYVVFGKASGFSPALDLSGLDGANGFRLDGSAWDGTGQSVSAAGDVNGDGFADLIVGAPSDDPNGSSYAGSSYVVFGGNFTGAVTKLGTAGNDNVTGTTAAERFVAGQGNDVLTGGGGADVLYGGAGNDTIRVPGLGFQHADGGSGFDTLALDGGGLTLNLADFRNQLAGIERINLTGSGNNTLTLLKRDMLNLSDTGNTLQVDGNTGDHYHFADSGWAPGADVTLVGVTYHTYDNGAAHLLLDAALTAV
jgi:hypothetical protein